MSDRDDAGPRVRDFGRMVVRKAAGDGVPIVRRRLEMARHIAG